MEIYGKTAVFPGGYGRIGVYRVKGVFCRDRKICPLNTDVPLRIDNSGWQLHKQSGDNSGSPQGILSSMARMAELTILQKWRI